MDERVWREMEELQKSPAWEVRAKLQVLTHSYQLHSRNYEELMALIRPSDNPEAILKLMSEDHREDLDLVIAEVQRRLHNFLASASSLVDHTTVHVKDLYKDSDFRREYQEAVNDRLKDVPVRRFIQELRNYSMHYRIPVAQASMSLTMGEDFRHSFQLPIRALRRWKKWTGPARTFLDACGENVELRQLTKDYMEIISEFYEWFRSRELEIHAQELDELETRMAELRRRLDQKGA